MAFQNAHCMLQCVHETVRLHVYLPRACVFSQTAGGTLQQDFTVIIYLYLSRLSCFTESAALLFQEHPVTHIPTWKLLNTTIVLYSGY